MKDEKTEGISQFKKNFLFVLLSNGIGLLLSVVMNVVLPIVYKDLISAYGYVQLYLLYVSYYYLFDFGLCNGVYLREGGNDYKKINHNIYSGQFIILSLFQVIVGLIIISATFIFVNTVDKQFVLLMVSFNILIMQQKTLLTSILQATNRIKEYSITVIICKLLNAAAIILSLAVGTREYKLLIVLLTVGELFSLLYATYQCKEIVFCKPAPLNIVKKEIIVNTTAGFSLLVSGVSAMLMIGIARLAIENQWGIEAFAKISFTVSLTNMFMLFINAISVVLYPQMKRTDDTKYIPLYNQMRCMLMFLLFAAIAFYYPMRLVLEEMMPQYHDSLLYMAILLPICLYSSKMALLIQTYMKVLRLERKLMIVNLISMGISILFTVVSVYFLNNMLLAVYSIMICQIIRTVMAEIILSKHIKISVAKDIAYELIMTMIFVVANRIVGGWSGTIIYIVFYICYLIIKRKDIKSSINLMVHKPRRN